MNTKLTALFVLPAFFLFSFSCVIHTTQKERIESVADWEGKSLEVMGILKTSGEKIEFTEGQEVNISEGNILITTVKNVKLEIDRDQIERIEKFEGKISSITTIDGQKYDVVEATVTEDKIIFESYRSKEVIPLNEVELLWVRKVDPGMTFVATIGGIAGVLLVAAVIIALTKESCPFIYSFDGEGYMFDAEPYGGAICQGLQRTEWCGLEHLKEVDGKYKIRITNEVAETQFTDELKLVVVDHEQGIQIAPDAMGGIHSIKQPVLPIQAYDQNGRDLMPYVRDNDWVYWKSRIADKNLGMKEDLREKLTFVFPKPQGAKKAKLLFNGCTTLWGSQMIKRFLELHGSTVSDLYSEINSFGPAFYRIMNWDLSQELYRLRIRVDTDGGEKSKGIIFGGGPFISENKAYPIDISDVSGNLLKITLTPPASFWMINHLAVDFTDDVSLVEEELEAISAIAHNGNDIRDLLKQSDNTYYIMPHIGNFADLVFKAPPLAEDHKRSVLLKAGGYYDIHLDTTGDPQTEVIEKCFNEPGFTVQFAVKEYRKWKEEIGKER